MKLIFACLVLAFSVAGCGSGDTPNSTDVVESAPTTTEVSAPTTTAAPTTTISAAQRAADLGLECEVFTAGSGRIGATIGFEALVTNPLNNRAEFAFAVDVYYTPSELALEMLDIEDKTLWIGSDDLMISDATPAGQVASAVGSVTATEPILNLSELECEIYTLEYRTSGGWTKLFES